MIEQKVENGKIIITKEPGDFVVCNLSSISLAKAVTDDVLERLIPVQVRMLDNVIDLNSIPVLQAQLTNQKYRAIGLGTYGWHHLLALKGIEWESEEALHLTDELYEKIAYLTIDASAELAKEKGAYPLFNGSDWHNGDYIKRKYAGKPEWEILQKKIDVYGLRNGYLMAPAPNASTALIAGSSAMTDPIFRNEYSEEKKDYKIPVTAPGITKENFERVYKKTAYLVDPKSSVRQASLRQKHVDQSASFNIYVPNTIKAAELLEIHELIHDSGMKTSYYLRSTASDDALEEEVWEENVD